MISKDVDVTIVVDSDNHWLLWKKNEPNENPDIIGIIRDARLIQEKNYPYSTFTRLFIYFRGKEIEVAAGEGAD